MNKYKASMWQGASGVWYVNCVNDLSGPSAQWWYPARILRISPADFLTLLINEYHADIHYHDENTLSYSWKNQADAHRWQLYINKMSRIGQK